ncbi:hypothetical protein [Streptomyces sp. NPDC046862]|uniref:hypothetical protein n=1 Tax=Streptomyces sp. NPDC046862 TaxID=3154603 RepID=UPI0034544AF7
MRHTHGPRAVRRCAARLRAACLRATCLHAPRRPTGVALAVVAAGFAAVPAYGAGTAATGAERLEVNPDSVVPGAEVTVGTVACGADGTAQGDASSVGAGTFTLVPGTPPGNATGRFTVPPSAHPGTYEIVVRCSEDGAEVAGDLVVTLTAAGERTHPRGSVKTGVGGALGPDPVQTAAGVTALAVAAAGGTWLLHRRARGEGI